MRTQLERIAARGESAGESAIEAIAELAAVPECPEALQYLLGMTYQMHGRSGVGVSSIALLAPSEFLGMCELKGWTVEPWEADLIFELDALLCHPPKD